MTGTVRRLPSTLSPWLEAAANLLYPPHCECCKSRQAALLEGQRFCVRCEANLSIIAEPYCSVCAEPFPAEMTGEFVCSNCAGRKTAFDFAYAPYEADGPARELIHKFKYENQLHLKATLGWLVSHGLQESRIAAHDDWLLVPVPLHSRRYRERNYNQSREIAKALQKLSGFQMIDGLRRIRLTSQQAELDRKARLANLANAFALSWAVRRRRSFEGKRILLIDDVLTTGATAHECAKVLKEQGGAKVVAALCVARG